MNESGEATLRSAPVEPSVVVLKPSEVLDKAADLIAPEGAWTQRAFARDRRGQRIYLSGSFAKEKATCWCIRGAVASVTGVNHALWHDAERFLPITDPASWNDTPGRTQAEAIAALRKAAELARAEGQ